GALAGRLFLYSRRRRHTRFKCDWSSDVCSSDLTGSFSEREAAMYVAQDQGFFRRYGLELTFVHVRSGPIGMAALAAGESQLHEEIGRASCRESGTVAVVGTRDNVTDPIVLW